MAADPQKSWSPTSNNRTVESDQKLQAAAFELRSLQKTPEIGADEQ